LDVLQIAFGEQYLDFAIVVVTHVDDDVTDADFNNDCRNHGNQVDKLLKRCLRRVVRIDNRNPKEEHIENLRLEIDKLSVNGNCCFNNDYLSCHEEVLLISKSMIK
jgi:hypothetical protein